MEKKSIFAHIQEMETQMGQIHSDLGEMKLIMKRAAGGESPTDVGKRTPPQNIEGSCAR
ncbi:hypothetical protein [Paenibacillus sp. FSL M7-0831]|uniref:hypothetical protein n=1 Tax=Paenibacillus sp. FSL M7-0831 TaxID=2975314 RepID=UPI004046D93C